jgi:hypothetical protein
MVAMATIPLPVVGRVRQRRQRVPQLLVETDGGNPKCILACTAMATVTTAPQLLVELDNNGDGSPVIGDGSPSPWRSHLQRQAKAVTAPPVIGDGSNSCQQSQTKAATSTTAPPVDGGEG